MADDDSPRLRVPHPGWLALVTALLAAIGVGLALWVYGGTRVRVSGHGWFVYPAQIESDPENVTLLSLEHREQVSNREETHERLLESLCHVVIVLPEGTPHPTGGGGGSSDGILYERLQWSVADGNRTRPPGVEVRFRLADRSLWVEGQAADEQRSAHGPFPTASGDVFLVRLGGDYSMTDVAPLGESITGRIDAARFERLLEKGAKAESQ